MKSKSVKGLLLKGWVKGSSQGMVKHPRIAAARKYCYPVGLEAQK